MFFVYAESTIIDSLRILCVGLYGDNAFFQLSSVSSKLYDFFSSTVHLFSISLHEPNATRITVLGLNGKKLTVILSIKNFS